MNRRALISWRISVCLAALASMLPTVVVAQEQPRISPIAMSANTPGLDITPKTMERFVAQTELSYEQLLALGLRPGKLDEPTLRKLLQLEAEDFRSRRFIGYFDSTVAKLQDRPPQDRPPQDRPPQDRPRQDRPAQDRPSPGKPPQERPSQDRPPATNWRDWQRLSEFDPFIQDAVVLGGFDETREKQLRNSLKDAAREGDRPEQIKARATAYTLLSEARQTAGRTSRGQRQLVIALKRELEGREFVPNIGLIIEIRSATRPPLVSPVSFVTMECTSEPRASTLAFTQRRRECTESGVCRVESIAEVSKGREYEAVFNELQSNGRTYLDGCLLTIGMLVDGAEITRQLPGRFTSHTTPPFP